MEFYQLPGRFNGMQVDPRTGQVKIVIGSGVLWLDKLHMIDALINQLQIARQEILDTQRVPATGDPF